MSQKTAKKLRQLYRRDVRQHALDLAEMIGNNLKPKPKWIPERVWLFLLGFFIKIKKHNDQI